ncbi:adenine phosphoribosyltransferase-like [Ornithodoros turicata]|uniref:adenine phosphoribosyltransferase-like n=1 Tax=Ornithodoros turicata TaxID=34597 RepID=UPI00313895B9
MNQEKETKQDSRMKEIKDVVRTYIDFPKKGIIFRDLMPVFQQPRLFRNAIDILAEKVKQAVPDIAAVVGIEARGFILGSPLALALHVAFVPVRKPGKLPGNVKALEYDLEYGKDKLEVQTDSFPSGAKVVIIDDLLATGGTMRATCDLIKSLGATVALCMVVMELEGLSGRPSDPFYSMIKFPAFNP